MSDSASVPTKGWAAVVEAAKRGDRDAFADLVGRYHRFVWSIAYSLTGSVANADDIAQETFLSVWRNLSKLRPDSVPGYLSRIARNFSVTQMRRVAADERARAKNAVTQPPDSSPLDRVITREEELAFHRAIGRIPEAYRLPLVLFYREDKSAARVAEALGLTEDNVRQRLVRGRKILHEIFVGWLEAAVSKGQSTKQFTAGILCAIAGTMVTTAPPASAGSRPSQAAYKSTSRWPAGKSWSAKPVLATVAAGAALTIAGAATVLGSRGTEERPGHRAVASTGSSRLAAAWRLPPRFERTTGYEAAELAAEQPSLSTPASSSKRSGRVFHLDFEDGRLPATVTGQIASREPGTSSRYALRAISGSTAYLQTTFSAAFPYSGTLVLALDYRTARETRLTINIFADPRSQKHTIYLSPTQRDVWTHLEIPLRGHVPDPDVEQIEVEQIAEGATVKALYINCRSAPDQALELDNLEIFEP